MTEAFSQQRGPDSSTDYATIQFIVQSILARVATATLVRIVSCTNNGGLSPWGFVNVQPVISQVSGNNVAVQHDTLFRLPYLRLQGGANAVIMDPVAGDIGLAVFCARDISALKNQANIDSVKGGARGVPPGSGRSYSMADGIYLGGMLNGVPTQFVRFSSAGMELVSPTKIRLQAPVVEIEAATSVTVDSPLNDIKGGGSKVDGKVFLSHTHTGVQSGPSNTGGVT